MTEHIMSHKALMFTLALMGCLATDPKDGDGGHDSSPEGGDDTGEGSIPFETVAESYTVPCISEVPKEHLCDEDSLVVVVTADAPSLSDACEAIPMFKPPDIDFADQLAVLSYLPWCNTVQGLRVDRVTLSGDTLRLDEIHMRYDGEGQEESCPYNLVTIPVVSYDHVETTLTTVMK